MKEIVIYKTIACLVLDIKVRGIQLPALTAYAVDSVQLLALLMIDTLNTHNHRREVFYYYYCFTYVQRLNNLPDVTQLVDIRA